ncbi:MAG: MaoC family dehydratase N-terminal domain-containing protein [Actinobacteria bacterium]|nr:MaoC family dehydratase N-terminal domain-containing protein [Actinomycetota bacterium]
MEAQLKAFAGQPYGRESLGPDPVNQPMIRHLVEALDDRNPIYVDADAARVAGHPGVVAPPTSLQVWTMAGLRRRQPAATAADAHDDTQGTLMSLLDGEGYVGVVATNCEQTYPRYLTLGDHLRVSSHLEDVSGLKHTALGEGFFVTTKQTYRDQGGEVVGEMLFRILKYRPGTGRERSASGTAAASTDKECQRLPELAIPLTPTVIVSTAIATRDYQDVHHDKDRAQELGSENIFMNILTTNGFVGRYITDWAGPAARLKSVAIRLGAPNYPGDTMTLTGRVTAAENGITTVAVRGSNRVGDHVVGTVKLEKQGATSNA